VETDHIVISMEEDDGASEDVELWVDAEGLTVKMFLDGELLPKETTAMMGNAIVLGMFWPLLFVDELDMDQALTEHADSPFEVSADSQERR